MLTVLADSSQTLAGSRDTSFSVEEARKRGESNHTDASDEFTVIMPLSRSRPVAKQRGRGKDGSNSPASLDDDRSRQLNSDAEQQEDEDQKDEDCVSETRMRGSFSPHLANDDEDKDKLYTCTMETQTSLTSSDDSRGDDVTPEITFKSVAVGPNGVNRKTQTESLPERDWAYDKRLPVKSGGVPYNAVHDSEKFALTEQTPQTSMDENDAQEEFLPMRVEPFAKMIKLETQPTEKESTPPVKYRRNLFDGGKTKYDESKPAHHMRAQPPFSSEGLNDQQRRQPESADDILSRQQLLLRQQQEVMAHIHHQQLEQQAQQLVNSALGLSNVTQPPVTNPSSSARERLSALLNDACILAPQAGGMAQVPVTGWMPAQRPLVNQSYVTPANVLGQEELMQAVRRELKRMQQE
ncbi:uncharacterized protein LOC112559071 isoform X2 [Pomacea canaliculata]|uniref:uncharacterized protein LOC112559071 isoform X2 n=1 Tax=Pomacea canaliculata TaxID=400727 RepID=UPI000D73B3D7|nr:uncharacterized protein LOC112559071 isoform X2 [Pomacea canaliculata]